MNSPNPRASVAFLLALVLLVPNQIALAHTGYPPVPVFTFIDHPDFPMEDFVTGHLGVLLKSYDQRYLYAAYRNLNGARFTLSETQAMKRGWEPLLNNRYKSTVAYYRFETSWREQWFRIRLHPGKDAAAREKFEEQLYAQPYAQKNGEQYAFFENCSDDAFRNALLTLRKREKRFGKNGSQVKAWLAAQDEVFDNCSESRGASGNHLPDVAADTDALLIRQDRAYQIAAAFFYRGDFDEAIARFRAIARDSASPWYSIAPYIVGRAQLRKAQLTAPKGHQFDADSLNAAAETFRSVIADKSRTKWHEPAANLLEFIEIRRNPSAVCSQLAVQLAKRSSLKVSIQPLTDYLYLVNENREDSSLPPKICSSSDDMTDWLLSFSGKPADNFNHSYQRWKTTGSVHWLLAALVNASETSSQSEELLVAAYNVPHTSPAYWSARFYRERMLIQKGRMEEVRHELDDDLRHAEGLANPLNPSSRNLFLALRARAALNLGDFLRFSIRTPSALVYLDEYNTKLTADDKDPRDVHMRKQYAAAHFDDDAGAVINNYLSLPQLLEAAQSSALPSDVRRDVTLMAFTRAIVTENILFADKIAQAGFLSAPDMADDLSAFLKSSTKQQKNFAAVWIILHHPEMQPALETGSTRATAAGQIDSFQDNWWAHFRFEPTTDGDAESLHYLRWWNRLPDHLEPVFPAGKIPAPAFVSEVDLSAARKDWDKLEHLALAGDWLASQTLLFARANPRDSRIPEALHLAVRATRFGHTDPHTPNYSRQAFQILHKKYPDSEWTKKTPYWY